jgi:hypothetical protein
MPATEVPSYLQPYTTAAQRYGGGFSALLWASPRTQRERFHALTRLVDFEGRYVLDVGCGRADLLDYLVQNKLSPDRYLGIEAVTQLADAARGKNHLNARIIEADFITAPTIMNIGADLIVFSGSLNTLDDKTFYTTLRHGFAAARRAVLFNFLSSPLLAGQAYLHWRPSADVLTFARTLSSDVQMLDDYLQGDCTMVLRRGEDLQ